MTNHNYGIALQPNKSTTIIRFESLRERDQFLGLLNKSKLNASINLFEEKQEEKTHE